MSGTDLHGCPTCGRPQIPARAAVPACDADRFCRGCIPPVVEHAADDLLLNDRIARINKPDEVDE